ncbi:RES domain-containing protein [Pantoea agglomerans]|uniref:RES domain-containing protein n=1 Tax=Enterobacter agglomerans TaxID=549 RepID=UPI003208A789
MDFKIFNEDIGVIGYKRLIHKIMFPGPSRKPLSDYIDMAMYDSFKSHPNFQFKISAFRAETKVFPKKTVFSRVRVIQNDDAVRFINGGIKISDFYPPNPKLVNLTPGRYNDKDSRVMYLSDSPETAEVECKVKDGDCFLRSQFTINREMAFFTLSKSSGRTKPFLDLINNDDVRFYPVITYLMNDILRFPGFHGCTYDSVPANKIKGFKSSRVNLVVWNDFINEVDFEYSFLSFRNNGNLYSYSLFYMEEGRVLSIDCGKESDKATKKHQDIYNRLTRETSCVKSIDKNFLAGLENPFKIVGGQ